MSIASLVRDWNSNVHQQGTQCWIGKLFFELGNKHRINCKNVKRKCGLEIDEHLKRDVNPLRCWHHNPKRKQKFHASTRAKKVQKHLNEYEKHKWDERDKYFNSREQHNESKTSEGIKLRRWLSTRFSAKSNWDLRVNKAPNELRRLHISPMLTDLRAEEVIWNDPSVVMNFSRSSIGFEFSFNLVSSCATISTDACSISWDMTRTPTGPIRLHKTSSAKLEV